jgi:hypothetical protein
VLVGLGIVTHGTQSSRWDAALILSPRFEVAIRDLRHSVSRGVEIL